MELEVLVEEDSAYELLRAQLGRWIGQDGLGIGVRRFQGKPDLLGSLENRLKGYAQRRASGDDVRVVVLVDRDDDDCVKLKQRMDTIARSAGLHTREGGRSFAVLNRIAVRELENWYFGDWQAVRAAYKRVPERAPAPYRSNPDHATAKTSAAFERLLERAGGRPSKPDWARRIGPYMGVESNGSPSFRQFIEGVRELTKG